MKVQHTTANGATYTIETYKVAGTLVKVRLHCGLWSYKVEWTWGPGNGYQAVEHAIKLAEKHAAGLLA